jgi:cytochrome c553
LPAAALAQDPIEEKAQLCAACHGEDGVPKDPKVPIIWGQHAGYLYIQLKDYKAKRRTNELMDPVVEQLEKPDMLALASYFEAKPWPNTGYSTPAEDEAKGQQIAVAAMCPACHGNELMGDSAIPRIAGQTQVYLERILIAFKTKERNNNPDKSNLMATFADDDLKLMSRFVAGR